MNKDLVLNPMTKFQIAFSYMIQNEDYPASDPRFGETTIDNDGGKVRLGVNSNAYPEMVQTDYYTTTDISEVIKTAMNLYNINEWKNICGDEIKSTRIGSKLLDMAVNMGSEEASKLAQRAAFGIQANRPGFKVDGVIGPISLKAINSVIEDTLLMRLVLLWQSFISQVIRNKPEYKKDEPEWRTRANKLPPAIRV